MSSESKPKPTPAQLALMIGGGLVAGAISFVVLGLGGAIGGAIIGLGVALGGLPYFRAVNEWQQRQNQGF